MNWIARLREREFILWFILVLLLLYGFTGIYDVLPLRPQSVHQWAQTDRASVALRFYKDGINFFLPRVHNIDNGTGITGVEFPFMNFIAAVLYHLFGFHEWLYRLTMLIIVSGGVVSAGALAKRILSSSLWASLVTLIWFLSPLLVYYSANFLPDAASLGFIMMGWLAFFKLKGKFQARWLVLLLFTTALAALIKIVSAISIIAMLVILLMDYFPVLKGPERRPWFDRKYWSISVLVTSLCLTAFWYLYASYLNNHYQAGYFLMQARHAESLSELWQLVRSTIEFWGVIYYSDVIWGVIIIAGICSLIFFKYVNRLLFLVAWLILLGSTGYYLLMSFQFRDHDYYFITLLPVGYFFLLLIADFLKRQGLIIQYVSLAAFSLLLISSAAYARNVQKERYAAEPPAFHAYFDLDPYLDSLHISRQDTIYSMFDESFDISLYLMDRIGYTFSPYLPEEYALFHLYLNIDYTVVNDTTQVDYPSVKVALGDKIGQHKGLFIYKSNIDQEKRERFYETAGKILEPFIKRIEGNKDWYGKIVNSARWHNVPVNWMIIPSANWLYNDDVTSFVLTKAKENIPEIVTPDGRTVDYSQLNEEGRSRLEELARRNIFDEMEMDLIKLNLHHTWVYYGTDSL